jgi:hypothetical protein
VPTRPRTHPLMRPSTRRQFPASGRFLPQALLNPINPRSGPGRRHGGVPVSHALPFQTHIRSLSTLSRTNIPLACGKDPGGRDHSTLAAFEAICVTGSSTLDCRERGSAPGNSGISHHAVFMTAPSIMTPAVTYFHSATSSLRAKAAMVTLRRVSALIRSKNHWLSAESG